MTNIVKTDNNSIHPLAVGITGIMLGAAGAAAIALSDEQTRKRATKKALQVSSDLQKWGSHKMDQMKQEKKSAQGVLNEKNDTTAEEIQENDI
ncbi:MAG: hypothetical protein ACR2LN_02630 [Candidatus Levyibacteriota bacterium]